MASKVMVKIPVTPFVQVNQNTNGELVTMAQHSSSTLPINLMKNTESITKTLDSDSYDPRLAQLEQNIRFLKEQHQLMLTGLHNEIESLRNKNRELQFQLIFAKNPMLISPMSSSSSSEEDNGIKLKFSSPKSPNTTPLQVELLEKELGEMKLQLKDIESRNNLLSEIIDEQTKKLECYERDKEKERAPQPDPELLRKLDDAEAIIRRLRRENNEYRPQYYRGGANGGGGGNGRGNGRNRTNYKANNWFPPLPTQNYWPSNGRTNGGGGGVNGTTNERATLNGEGGAALPNLQPDTSGHYHGRRGTNNNNHYSESRKYRGGQQHRKAS